MLNFIWGHFQQGQAPCQMVLLLSARQCQSTEGLQQHKRTAGNIVYYISICDHFQWAYMPLYPLRIASDLSWNICCRHVHALIGLPL